MVKLGGKVSWRALHKATHGLDYAEQRYGQLAEQLGGNPVQIAPLPFVGQLQELLRKDTERDEHYPLLLIGKRTLNMMNSWQMDLPNARKREQTLTCELHPLDAAALGIADGDRVEVVSSVGRIELAAELSPLLKSGTVCIQHGWGSRVFDPARAGEVAWVAGVNRNLLVDHRHTDPFSGTPKFNSTAVRVSRLRA